MTAFDTAYNTPEMSDADFLRLANYIQTYYGINLHAKRALIEGRLANMLKSRNFSGYTEFLDMLFADSTGTEMTNILNKLTTNHTYFMREREHYDFMKTVFLPDMLKTKKDKTIRIWSAGCSSGEEPYTTQMQTMDFLGVMSINWNTTITATDISQNVLSKAREGIFSIDSMKNLPPIWIKKFFEPLDNNCYRVSEKVRDRVKFDTFNLMNEIPAFTRKYDLIFCRNVMIYFDAETKLQVINRFYDVLNDGGYLFIGHAETISRATTKFEYIKPAIYRKPPGKAK